MSETITPIPQVPEQLPTAQQLVADRDLTRNVDGPGADMLPDERQPLEAAANRQEQLWGAESLPPADVLHAAANAKTVEELPDTVATPDEKRAAKPLHSNPFTAGRNFDALKQRAADLASVKDEAADTHRGAADVYAERRKQLLDGKMQAEQDSVRSAVMNGAVPDAEQEIAERLSKVQSTGVAREIAANSIREIVANKYATNRGDHIDANGGAAVIEYINEQDARAAKRQAFREHYGVGKVSAQQPSAVATVVDRRSQATKELERPEGVSWKDWYNASSAERRRMVAEGGKPNQQSAPNEGPKAEAAASEGSESAPERDERGSLLRRPASRFGHNDGDQRAAPAEWNALGIPDGQEEQAKRQPSRLTRAAAAFLLLVSGVGGGAAQDSGRTDERPTAVANGFDFITSKKTLFPRPLAAAASTEQRSVKETTPADEARPEQPTEVVVPAGSTLWDELASMSDKKAAADAAEIAAAKNRVLKENDMTERDARRIRPGTRLKLSALALKDLFSGDGK
ncbi:hypothetical protein CR970_01805 [Candidatus Saccharibacteria bacterium]|nr:MAG: hypothetical protein CR970_01805 [Candidatus Saccharibacteria bacterium]